MNSPGPNPKLAQSDNKSNSKRVRVIRIAFLLIFICILGLVTLVVVVSLSPPTGAWGADFLRDIVGPKPVAILEAFVFTVQDQIHQVLYRVKQVTPASPWVPSTPRPGTPLSINDQQSISTLILTSTAHRNLPNTPALENPAIYPMRGSKSTSERTIAEMTPAVAPTPIPTQILTQVPWIPGNIPPLGTMPDEGVWTPYITAPSNTIVAYKTFLQPDPKRPYVVMGIVAFDLSRIQLHNQLGLFEPDVPDKSLSTGQIPDADLQPGVLLAAFNGGFKTLHGHYGIFVDGREMIPAIDKMGTIAIYIDNTVRIGEWGKDLAYSPDMIVFRQNCPLMVRNGEINPVVYNNSVNDWGGTFSGNILTFRSGLGIDQEGKTLYYFAGNPISMPILVEVMLHTGTYQAMQLDINSYYVFFSKFEFRYDQWSAEPLLPKEMVDNIDRFLSPYPHDFFYITVRQ